MPESSEPKRVPARPTKNFLDAIEVIIKDTFVDDDEKMRLITTVTTNYIMDHPEIEVKVG